MPSEVSSHSPAATDLVTKFEQANNISSLDSAMQSAAIMSKSDQGSWSDAKAQLQNFDLARLGLPHYAINDVDLSSQNSSGTPAAPELIVQSMDGTSILKIDSQGNISDQANVRTGNILKFSDTTGGGSDNISTTGADTGSDSADATPFGANDRTMTLSTDKNSGVYNIQSGDTLWAIAQDVLTKPGETLSAGQQSAMAPQILALVDQIASDNNISNSDEIYPGQQITINNLNQNQLVSGDQASTQNSQDLPVSQISEDSQEQDGPHVLQNLQNPQDLQVLQNLLIPQLLPNNSIDSNYSDPNSTDQNYPEQNNSSQNYTPSNGYTPSDPAGGSSINAPNDQTVLPSDDGSN